MQGETMLTAVLAAVEARLGGEYPVLPWQDGTPLPHMLVRQRSVEQLPDSRQFFNRAYIFRVSFHPEEAGADPVEICRVEEALLDCLRQVHPESGPVRASRLVSRLQDGELAVTAKYQMRVCLELGADAPMQELSLTKILRSD